jgi:hypothetical protein
MAIASLFLVIVCFSFVTQIDRARLAILHTDNLFTQNGIKKETENELWIV